MREYERIQEKIKDILIYPVKSQLAPDMQKNYY